MYQNKSECNIINYPKKKYFIAVVGTIFLLTINMCDHGHMITSLQIPWFHTQVWYNQRKNGVAILWLRDPPSKIAYFMYFPYTLYDCPRPAEVKNPAPCRYPDKINMLWIKYHKMRKVLSRLFCAAAYSQSQIAMPDSDPRWGWSDARLAMYWPP